MKKRKVKKDKKQVSFKLNAVKFGLAWAIILSLSALMIVLFGMYGYFPFLNLIIADMYGRVGYSLTWGRVFLAPIYCFIEVFIGSWLFAIIYNKLVK